MAEQRVEHQTTEPHVSDAPHGHEQSDVELRPLLYIAGILIGVTLFVFVLLWVAMQVFEREERRADRPLSPVAAQRPAPPEPRLQPTIQHHPTLPYEDVQAMLRHNHQILSNYGWVDRDREIVHIPIAAAMERMLQQAGQEAQDSPAQQQPQQQHTPAKAPQEQPGTQTAPDAPGGQR
jgi:hypothetical protein